MADNRRFQRLLEPYHIGPVKTRNRMIKSGAGMFLWRQDELHMNARVIAFYEALAKGGVGLIIVESPTIDYPSGARWRERYRIDDDRYIEGLSELTAVIHKHGCPTFMQMNHDGPWQLLMWEPTPMVPCAQPIAASPVTINSDNDFHNQVPRELTISEIEEIVDKFACAAVRARKAGFDGVDINAASSHLLHNFLSPFWNRRQDSYGGSLQNRAKFVLQIVNEIKRRLGKDFPVTVCINGVEVGRIVGIRDDQCLTLKEAVETARLLQEAGADAIQVRSNWIGYHVGGFLPEALFFPDPSIPLESFPADYDSRHHGAGATVPLGAVIKRAVPIPVIAVGRLDPILGEQVLRADKADFIALTRRLFADPELPNKVASQRLEDIAPCTACHECLNPFVTKRCRINALLGSDEPYEIRLAEKRKKVLVIGGGPAGMEAARVAALRGHEVMLYEKSHRLGGLLPIAALVKGSEIEDLPAIVRYLEGQITKLGVKTRCGKEVDVETIEQVKPDVVILAAGGIPTVPDIAGINRPNVISAGKLYTMLKICFRFVGPKTLRWLTKFWMPIGRRVVILGGGKHGCQLAEFLAKRGRHVTIVDTTDTLGDEMLYHLRSALFSWFQKKGVAMMAGVKYVEITDEGLTVINREGEKQTILADSIVPAVPLMTNTDILKRLEGKVPEVYAVGDCKRPLEIVDAVAEGSRVARSL